MANLTIALLGLNRISASMGLALHRYMKKGGKHQFRIIGYDVSKDLGKQALKLGAIDHNESSFQAAVSGADLVVLATSYEEAEDSYRLLAQDLRDGAVVLDLSPLKSPSLKWAEKYFNDEQHLVGISPIVNPNYLFEARDELEYAEEDLFDTSAILLSPSAKCIKEAVDLAFNFCQIIGSKPRFLDPLEHDTLLAQTLQVPRVLGTMLFYHLTHQVNWEDLKWLTNPAFGVLTRPLFDTHPDALRDEFVNNHIVLTRALDSYMASLKEFRDILASGDKKAIEAVSTEAAQSYEAWINSRYRADWDAASRGSDVQASNPVMQSLLGEKLANRLMGKKGQDE